MVVENFMKDMGYTLPYELAEIVLMHTYSKMYKMLLDDLDTLSKRLFRAMILIPIAKGYEKIIELDHQYVLKLLLMIWETPKKMANYSPFCKTWQFQYKEMFKVYLYTQSREIIIVPIHVKLNKSLF